MYRYLRKDPPLTMEPLCSFSLHRTRMFHCLTTNATYKNSHTQGNMHWCLSILNDTAAGQPFTKLQTILTSNPKQLYRDF
jgi:hypothetical protein